MSIVSVAHARNRLADVIDRSRNEAVFIERRGQRAAVVVSAERYKSMMEALDYTDNVAVFNEAMAEEGPNIPGGSGEGRPGLDVTDQVELRVAAVRALKRIDHHDRDRIGGAIAPFGEDPRPPGANALRVAGTVPECLHPASGVGMRPIMREIAPLLFAA